MKIIDISIENLGPYIGENSLHFDVENPARNVILIGGKNGAGKTTLFNAIKIGIYGCRAYGFESENVKYLELISNLINRVAKFERDGVARIIISILMEDGKDDFKYRFERSWKLSTKNLREELRIYRNGIPLDETEKSDFQSYLLQLIPPDMFQFYFFDGESIGNFVFNGLHNTDFRNAFLKLCGLDTMDIIHENLLRLSRTRKKDLTGAFEDYQIVVNQFNQVENELTDAISVRKTVQDDIATLDEKLVVLEHAYMLRGGISKKDYASMQIQISREEARRDSARKWLKETANDVIPFVILSRQLVALRSQIISEDRQQTAQAFQSALNSPATHNKLFAIFAEAGVSDPIFLSEKVISSLAESVEGDGVKPVLNLSKREQLDLAAKISGLLAFDSRKVAETTKVIEDSREATKKIRKKLEKSDTSGADHFFDEKERILAEKQECLRQLLDVERKVDELSANRAEIGLKLKNAQKRYEDSLKARSVNDIAAKAILAFTDLQKRLYKKYVADVECGFKECFSALINKPDLIDGITIDDQLQVFPYKDSTFTRADLKRTLQRMGESYFISQLGNAAYEAFIADFDGTSEEITLPVEVKQQLSAGEKQIFIMALYQALSKLNKVSVPYLIDTPFARIDNEHRQNILNNFFVKLKGQIIILSTDEEIVGEHRASIEDVISDYYLLKHTDNGWTEIMNSSYFGGEINGE